MNTTITTALGIAFVALAIAAVLLQAWLWGPKYWNAATKTSHAPRFWVNVHRAVGWAYAAIYVAMMTEMLPRLWEYQVELPARTVVHAVAAITIGVVLAVKISILRFFRHFEEAMPTLGVVILVCTVVLATFSLPFALRARGSDATFAESNIARVRTILGRLELGEGPDVEALASVDGLERGREVVMQRCSVCHDLRTVIAEPRTGAGWVSVSRRMQDKPTLAEPLTDDEVLFAAAYLIAITPILHDDVRRRDEEAGERFVIADRLESEDEGEPIGLDDDASAGDSADAGADASTDAGALDAGPPDAGVAMDAGRPRARRRRDAGPRDAREALALATADGPDAGGRPPSTTDAGPRLRYSAALARDILDRRCIDCHGMEDIEEYGGGDRPTWTRVIQRMIRRGAEITEDEARVLAQYLAATYPPADG